MILTTIFAISGVCLVVLLATKMFELKHKKSVFPLNFISKSDHRIKEATHLATQHYSELKEKSGFLIKKQLPLHTKNVYYKTESLVKEKIEKYLGDIRNTKILNKKNDGISEFFKNLSDKENGDSQNGKDLVE